jgi:hypothetical protein
LVLEETGYLTQQPCLALLLQPIKGSLVLSQEFIVLLEVDTEVLGSPSLQRLAVLVEEMGLVLRVLRALLGKEMLEVKVGEHQTTATLLVAEVGLEELASHGLPQSRETVALVLRG